MAAEPRPVVLFAIGQLVATPGALALFERANESAYDYLMRHVTGDFGDLCEEDVQANRQALETGARVLSSYRVGGERIWVITDADRATTTLLLPEEY